MRTTCDQLRGSRLNGWSPTPHPHRPSPRHTSRIAAPNRPQLHPAIETPSSSSASTFSPGPTGPAALQLPQDQLTVDSAEQFLSGHQTQQQQQERRRDQLSPTLPYDAATFADHTNRTVADLLLGYRSLYEEYEYWVDDSMVEGTIPAALNGTLLRNGPGLFEIFGARINQPFDGDGMICSFAFREGRLFFRNRFVRTDGFVKEQEAGRMLFKNVFSTGNPTGSWFYNPFDFNFKNVANTGILHWGNRLLALHESGLPYVLDPESLETRGLSRLGGVLQKKEAFSAHYRITTEPDGSKRWVTFSNNMNGGDQLLTFFEFAEDGQLLHRTEATIPGGAFGFYHDMAMTEHYYVMFQNPAGLDTKKLLTEYIFGRASMGECIMYDDTRPMKIWLLPRPGRGGVGEHVLTKPKVFETKPFFTFHHANAYESADGQSVVIDSVAWDRLDLAKNLDSLTPDYFKSGQRTELHRTAVHIPSGSVRRQALSHRVCEFPVVHPATTGKPHTHIYAAGSRFDDPEYFGAHQVIMKLTVPPTAGLHGPFAISESVVAEAWCAGERCFTQECVFVPREGGTREDDGWLLTLVHNAESQKAELCILDAQKVSDGPVARIRLPHHIPHGLHGSWSSAYLGPDPAQAAPGVVVKNVVRGKPAAIGAK